MIFRIASESGPRTQAAKEVVKSTVAGVYTIYDEVVNSGLHLVQQSSHATAEVLGHKYGDEVHRAAESTADIVDSAAHTVVNVNMLGYKALAKRIAANSTVDILSDEQEKKERQSNRVGINPMHAVQGLMIANNMTNELEKHKEETRKRRQEYVGMAPLEDDEDNYKMVQQNNANPGGINPEIVMNAMSNMVMNNAMNNNGMDINGNMNNNNNESNRSLQSDLSMSSMSGMNDEPSNHYNGLIDANQISFNQQQLQQNNDNVNNNNNLSIFEDETLDVD